MKTSTLVGLATAVWLAPTLPAAAHNGGQHHHHAAPAASHAGPAAAELADGEVRRIDLAGKRVTLRHGEIKNLDMPGMTMAFEVEDGTLLQDLKVGDKVQFAAVKKGRAVVITQIQLAP